MKTYSWKLLKTKLDESPGHFFVYIDHLDYVDFSSVWVKFLNFTRALTDIKQHNAFTIPSCLLPWSFKLFLMRCKDVERFGFCFFGGRKFKNTWTLIKYRSLINNSRWKFDLNAWLLKPFLHIMLTVHSYSSFLDERLLVWLTDCRIVVCNNSVPLLKERYC